MAGEVTPNLRSLLTELATWASSRYPDIVPASDVERISTAINPLLVVSRVLCQVCLRVGLAKGDLDAMVARCKGLEDSDLMTPVETVEVEAVHATGRMEPMSILRLVDEVMASPSTMGRLPRWFLDDLWPGVLRRAARGVTPTDRELHVALAVVSEAKGER